jgi:hypothetical protein
MYSMPWPEHKPWAATSVADIARAAVGFHQQGPANRGFDLHVPGGITAAAICDAVGQALGRDIQYQRFDGPTRQFVESYPLPDAMKDLYAGLFAYFRDGDYRGDPEPVIAALDGFSYSTVADVVTAELLTGQENSPRNRPPPLLVSRPMRSPVAVTRTSRRTVLLVLVASSAEASCRRRTRRAEPRRCPGPSRVPPRSCPARPSRSGSP